MINITYFYQHSNNIFHNLEKESNERYMNLNLNNISHYETIEIQN